MTEVALHRGELERLRSSNGEARPNPWLVALPTLAFLAVTSTLMLRRVEPFVNWYYVSAWYPTLLLLDAAAAARTGRYYLLARPRFALSLLGWSAVLWFFFELVNFRVANWYYVFLPPQRSLRWLGTTIAFATVLPAIFLAERWLAARGTFEGLRWPRLNVSRSLLAGVFVAGVGFAALSLAWPRIFFPLIWGALTLVLEPWNYRRDRSRSLLGDLAVGQPARLLRLVCGGLAVGFIWELYNIEARGKWIYTVPGFESFKLFEMPLLGFGGFPIFALDCFVVYQSLVLSGVAVAPEPEEDGRRVKPWRTLAAASAAALFSLGALLGMDHFNTDSLRPRVEDLWVASAEVRAQLARTPYGDLFILAEARPEELARETGASIASAEGWVEAARLATLRGIGTENARLLWETGVGSVGELAAADPERLMARLRELASGPRTATPAKVRVWIRAARRAQP